MRIPHTLVGVGLVLTVMYPVRAHGQTMSPAVHFGASGGLAIPLSNLSTQVQTGFYVSGLVEGRPSNAPFDLRGEVSFSGYNGKGGFGRTFDITGFTGNVVFPFDQVSHSGPYLIGGLGLYHTSYSGIVSENDFGVNFGGGMKWQLNGVSTFAEIRYHYISAAVNSRQILPLTFGVTF